MSNIKLTNLEKEKKVYTEEEKNYIRSKIPNIKWESISDSSKEFWIDWREKNEKKYKPTN